MRSYHSDETEHAMAILGNAVCYYITKNQSQKEGHLAHMLVAPVQAANWCMASPGPVLDLSLLWVGFLREEGMELPLAF